MSNAPLFEDHPAVTGCTVEQLDLIEHIWGLIQEKGTTTTVGNPGVDTSIETSSKLKYNGYTLEFEHFDNDAGVSEVVMRVKQGKKHLFVAEIDLSNIGEALVEVSKDLIGSSLNPVVSA